MASLWVKVLAGGFLAAAIGSAVGQSIPVEQGPDTGKTEAISPEFSAPVVPERKSSEKTPEDYALVRQAAGMSAKGDGISLLLNLRGELCAEVTFTKHLVGDRFEITCIENRSGSGMARYAFDAATGEARRLS